MLDKLKNIDPNILVLIGGSVLVFVIFLFHIVGEYKKTKNKNMDNNNLDNSIEKAELTQISKKNDSKQTEPVNMENKTSEITKRFLENLKQNKVFLALGIGILIGVGMITIPNMYRVYKAKKEVMAVLEGQHSKGMCDDIEPIAIQKVVYQSYIKNDTGEIIKFKCIKNRKIVGIGIAQYHDNRIHEGLSITY